MSLQSQDINLGGVSGTKVWFPIENDDEVSVQTTVVDDSVAWPTSTLTVKVSNDREEAYGFDATKPTAGTAVTLTGEQITEPLNVSVYEWLCVELTTPASSAVQARVIVKGRSFPRGF